MKFPDEILLGVLEQLLLEDVLVNIKILSCCEVGVEPFLLVGLPLATEYLPLLRSC